MSVRNISRAAILLVLTTCSVHAVVRHVPGTYQTVQAAINASAMFDTVLVAEGIYHEQIDFQGKPIVVASAFILDGDPSHIEQTVIMAAFAGRPETLSAVLFISGETPQTRLQGFTVQGGGFTILPEHGETPEFACGGAVLCSSGSPTIADCILSGDVCASSPGGNPTILRCTLGSVNSYDYPAVATLVACTAESIYVDYGADVAVRRSVVNKPIWVPSDCYFSADSSSVKGSIRVWRGGARVSYSSLRGISVEMDGFAGADNSIIAGDCGIWGWDGYLGFDGCTILGTVTQSTDEGTLRLANSIVSAQAETAIKSGGAHLDLACVLVDTTAKLAISFSGRELDTSHVLYASPRFCDPAGEFAIRDNSICAPSNNACNQLIGAGEVGCLCCIGVRGNANGLEGIDLTDLSTLILYLVSARGTVTGDWCPSEANVDSKGIIDVSDLSYLISYLTSPPGTVTLLPCPYSSLASLRSGPGVRPRVEP